MDRKKLLLIYNPKSGTGKIKGKLSDVIDMCVKEGYEVTIRPTQGKLDAMEYLRENAARYDKVICSGGDGTLDEVVKGILASGEHLPIGYIPAGSTNDFANSLGISSMTMKAAKAAVYGEPFACDIGKFNDDYFVYVAAFGILTDVSYETSQKTKNVLGHMAYVLEGIKSFGLNSMKSYSMSVIADDRIIKDEFIYGMVSNSATVGGFKALPQGDICLNDGEFEVLLIKYPHSLEEVNIITSSLLAQDPDPEYMYYLKTSHLEFHSEEGISWTLDGENGGVHNDVEIINCNKAFTICVPEKKKKRV
ncbi:MAG: YegS/Rv2252/BmrU family lipid kinase [Lachnospiraceae bacterium]|nr:YegS/Rv2252/BmrU family lipid kinase [Lachnospiraceae bacterium]MBQ7832969.1 YegS/Rv2252/BmrU family lipid kinase [Lachnospiraceae bacterium]